MSILVSQGQGARIDSFTVSFLGSPKVVAEQGAQMTLPEQQRAEGEQKGARRRQEGAVREHEGARGEQTEQ